MKKHHDVWDRDVEQILISEKELDEIVTRMAAQIDADYRDKNLLLLCILKGSLVFMGDLMKKLSIPCEIDCMKVSSYGNGSVSSGRINILLDLHRHDLSEKDILIIEDIIDSGRTLSYLVSYLQLGGARSVRAAALLDKPSRREVDYTPDYVGREIPDAFVVGYGLDYGEKYRSLPYVGILKPEIYLNK
ncbi:MAG: hypoxanthine phosphoribosyltransferase [Clostridiales bacterium]|nr:hypoxanthine phosphoribosyltransferase [Clostridiales bacterium]